jgi:hypothetical protein
METENNYANMTRGKTQNEETRKVEDVEESLRIK